MHASLARATTCGQPRQQHKPPTKTTALLPICCPPRTTLLWFIVAVIGTQFHHCGYRWPFVVGNQPNFHDLHHEKFNCNYGLIGFLDKLHGTEWKGAQGSISQTTTNKNKDVKQSVRVVKSPKKTAKRCPSPSSKRSPSPKASPTAVTVQGQVPSSSERPRARVAGKRQSRPSAKLLESLETASDTRIRSNRPQAAVDES